MITPLRRLVAASLFAAAAWISGLGASLAGACGPFTDVSDAAFCPFVLEIFTLAITTGTNPTTYDPDAAVSRLQMAAFLSRTVDRALQRSSRRAALRQFWRVQGDIVPMTATLAGGPGVVEFDGADLWVALGAGMVARIRASDGAILETWTGASDFPGGILVAMGSVLVASQGVGPGLSGRLYRIDPRQAAGAATLVASDLPEHVSPIAFDGARIWISSIDGSVSIVTPGPTLPWTVTTVTSGFVLLTGVLDDGSNAWVTDTRLIGRSDGPVALGSLSRLDKAGSVLQTVTVGTNPQMPLFDGTNIWVPNRGDDSVSVVRASSGSVLATLTGNGLNLASQAAFDGERVLVNNVGNGSVSLWKAADLSPLGAFPLPSGGAPYWACSDGIRFWISLPFLSKLARF